MRVHPPAYVQPASLHLWQCGRQYGAQNTSSPAGNSHRNHFRRTGSVCYPEGGRSAPCLDCRATDLSTELKKNIRNKSNKYVVLLKLRCLDHKYLPQTPLMYPDLCCRRLICLPSGQNYCSVPLSGRGRPNECWQRTNSAPSDSFSRTGVPMRVIIPMLATTYGESVNWTPNFAREELTGPMLNGITYIVRPGARRGQREERES